MGVRRSVQVASDESGPQVRAEVRGLRVSLNRTLVPRHGMGFELERLPPASFMAPHTPPHHHYHHHHPGVGFDINCGVRLIRTNLTEADIADVREQLAQVSAGRAVLARHVHLLAPGAAAWQAGRASASFWQVAAAGGRMQLCFGPAQVGLSLPCAAVLGVCQDLQLCGRPPLSQAATLPAPPRRPCLTTSPWVWAARASSPPPPRTWRRRWRWAWTGACGRWAQAGEGRPRLVAGARCTCIALRASGYTGFTGRRQFGDSRF